MGTSDRHVPFTLLVVILGALTSGCAGEARNGGPATDEPPASGQAADAPADAPLPAGCHGLEAELPAAEIELAALREAFGPPDSVRTATQPNRHVEGVTDTILTAHYPGMMAELHRPGGGSDLTSRFEARSNRYLAFPAIGIGAPEARVVSALGEPTERTGDVLVYNCGEGADQPVTFHLEDGRVHQVTITYYVD